MTLGPPTSRDVLAMFTIYDHPRDHPGKYVVRRFTVRDGEPVPDPDCVTADDLEGARRLLPPGLFNLGRDPGDDPAIVETWI